MQRLALCLLTACSFALSQTSPTGLRCVPDRMPAVVDALFPAVALALDVRGFLCMYLSILSIPSAVAAIYGALGQHC